MEREQEEGMGDQGNSEKPISIIEWKRKMRDMDMK